jgi:hypothetical protein
MKIHQLSIFAENKPGHLAGPCRLLAEAGVDIRALALADTQTFGILRLIVSDAARATRVLETAGHVVKATEVLAVAVAGHDGKAVLIFRFDDPDRALAILQRQGVAVLAGDELLGR